MAQDFGCTVVLTTQAQGYFSSAAVESKDKPNSGIIECSS
jgi:hypothetical protein